MTRAARNFAVVVTVVAGCFVAAFWSGKRATSRLQADGASIQQQLKELRAAAMRKRSQGTAGPFTRDDAELERMRAEIAALQEVLDQRNRIVAAEIEKRRSQVAETAAPKKAQSRPAARWANAGRAEPRAAFESVLWAIDGGDVDALRDMLAFDPEAQREADLFFSQLPPEVREKYGDARSLVASVMVAQTRPNFDTVEVAKADVTNGDYLGASEAELSLKLSRGEAKQSKSARLRFRRSNGGGNWRLLVPAKVIEGYRFLVAGVPRPG